MKYFSLLLLEKKLCKPKNEQTNQDFSDIFVSFLKEEKKKRKKKDPKPYARLGYANKWF